MLNNMGMRLHTTASSLIVNSVLCFLKSLPLVVKQHQLWFFIYGFNITIIAGLFSLLFSRLLGE
jgi:hypothetical protein